MNELEIVLMYIESQRVKVNKVERSLEDTKKHIEKYIDENKVNQNNMLVESFRIENRLRLR